ncbi:DoxX family protein [Mycobacterium sp. NPDC003323]
MLVRRIARPLLSAAFIGQGIEALRDVKPAAEVVQPTLDGLQSLPEPVAAKVPDNAVTVARINAAVQIGGGVLLATGKVPRVAAGLLAATVIPANLGKHMFWEETDPVAKAEKRRAFLTDLSLIGGLVLASADTAGKPSLGWRGRRAGRRVAQAVSERMPSSSDSVLDSELAEKLGHGVHVGVERGRGLADAARERGVPLATSALETAYDSLGTAYDRSAAALHKGAERSAPIAKKARKRSAELAETALDRSSAALERSSAALERAAEKSAPLAAEARRRGAELAETAIEQGSDQVSSGWRRVRSKI